MRRCSRHFRNFPRLYLTAAVKTAVSANLDGECLDIFNEIVEQPGD
jgi:hypothetical protein